jgi:SAM-dependent methyltransferase
MNNSNNKNKLGKAKNKVKNCNNTGDSSLENCETHWSAIYNEVDDRQLSWYEDKSTPSLNLIKKCNLHESSRILCVGAGSSTIIDFLIENNYKNIIANDISGYALDRIKDRIGSKQSYVNWIIDDLTKPTKLLDIQQVDLWYDRAVLHFFIEDHDQDVYFKLLHKKVNLKGYVLFALFNLEGADRCSGLPVKRYNSDMLQEKLGQCYLLKDSFKYIYTMPNGDKRNYVYTLFQKTC